MLWAEFFRIACLSRSRRGVLSYAEAARQDDETLNQIALDHRMLTLPRDRPDGISAEADEWRRDMQEDARNG